MVNKYMPPVSYPGGNFYANIFAMSRVITTYIQWLFLPINIYATVSGEPSFISRSLLEPRVLFSASLLITIFVFAFKLRKRAKEFSFSAFWFFITLLPVSNAFPLANYIASRYLYIPSAGFCFFLAFALFKLPDSAIFGAKRNILRLLAIYAIIALIMSYSIFTLARNNVFRDNISLLAEQVKKYPDNPRVHFDLGNRFREKGLLGEAIREYRIAIKFDPYHAPFHKELGIAYCQEGDLKEALNEMEMAFQLDNHLPKLAEAYNYLGYAFRDKKLYDKAIASWSKAVQLKPDYSEVYYDLGNTYADVRKNEESILAYKKAIETDPNYLEAYNNLASVYTVTGKIDKAIDLWNKAVQISPNFAIAHFNLAVFYFQKKEYGLAIKHCDKVIALGGKVDPKFLELLKPYRK
jgi:tetratricopeptide (TPR) repeat protein